VQLHPRCRLLRIRRAVKPASVVRVLNRQQSSWSFCNLLVLYTYVAIVPFKRILDWHVKCIVCLLDKLDARRLKGRSQRKQMEKSKDESVRLHLVESLPLAPLIADYRDAGLPVSSYRTLEELFEHAQPGCGVIGLTADQLTAQPRAVLDEFRRLPGCASIPCIAWVDQWLPEFDGANPITDITPVTPPWLTPATLRLVQSRLNAQRNLQKLNSDTSNAASLKADFLANVSHEIRTPLTAMLGYAELLGRLEDDPVKSTHIGTISRNGRILAEIINDILSIAKLESGQEQVHLESFDPRQLVSDIAETLNHTASQKAISLRAACDHTVPARLKSDPVRLRQILTNLLGNAVKFTETGGVTLTASWAENTLTFRIVDTGKGIHASQVRNLFQPFVQGDSSITRQHGGTGLGLPISRSLARLLGGDLKLVASTPAGSEFMAHVEAQLVTLASESEPDNGDALYKLNCKALIVDDQRDVRYLARHVLEAAGADVVEGADGIECLEILQKQTDIDVVLLDMQMPGMDGYTAARSLRTSGFTKPILAVTTNVMPGDRERCLESGCTAFMGKPIKVDALLRVVSRLVEDH